MLVLYCCSSTPPVEFILEDFEKVIDNSTGNSTGSKDSQKIKYNSTLDSTGTSFAIYHFGRFRKIITGNSATEEEFQKITGGGVDEQE